MSRLIAKSILFLSLLAVSNAFLFYALPRDDYLAAIVDKHRRLDGIETPKIVFVGGSGLAFGLDSEAVESAFQADVVNMGLHAQLGLRYMLEEIKPALKPGDTVVLVPEYNHFYGLLEGGRELLEALLNRPESLASLSSYRQMDVLVQSFPSFIQRKLRALIKSVGRKNRSAEHAKRGNYRRDGFNDLGDYVAHVAEPSLGISDNHLFGGQTLTFDAESVSVLNRFHQYAASRRIQTFILFPAIPEREYADFAVEIDRVFQNLKRDSLIPVVADPGTFVLPETDFYDTVYHLTGPGRERRTERIISCLQIRGTINPRTSAEHTADKQDPTLASQL